MWGGEGTCEGWASKSKSECKRGGSQEFGQQADTLSTMELTCPGLRTSIMSSGKQVLDSGLHTWGCSLLCAARALIGCSTMPALCPHYARTSLCSHSSGVGSTDAGVLSTSALSLAPSAGGGVGGGSGGAGFSPPWKNATSTSVIRK